MDTRTFMAELESNGVGAGNRFDAYAARFDEQQAKPTKSKGKQQSAAASRY